MVCKAPVHRIVARNRRELGRPRPLAEQADELAVGNRTSEGVESGMRFQVSRKTLAPYLPLTRQRASSFKPRRLVDQCGRIEPRTGQGARPPGLLKRGA